MGLLASNFKSETAAERFEYLHPFLQEMLFEMIQWLSDRNIHGVITETVTTPEEDAALGRKSVSHQEGRASDLRTRDWPRNTVKEFLDHFNEKYLKHGATRASNGQLALLVFHDSGHGEHIHIQLARSYALKMPKSLSSQRIA